MKFLPTAFGQLAFAWKLYDYGLDDNIDLSALDKPLRFEGGQMVFVVPPLNFRSDDLQIALENNLGIAFGAAAITLNRALEEAGYQKPTLIDSERDQCIAVVYQIRNAFAHDIAEPRWSIKGRYKREYNFGGLNFDLTNLDGKQFTYEQIGGPDALFSIRDYVEANFGF